MCCGADILDGLRVPPAEIRAPCSAKKLSAEPEALSLYPQSIICFNSVFEIFYPVKQLPSRIRWARVRAAVDIASLPSTSLSRSPGRTSSHAAGTHPMF
jgi:hypothetical protein